MVQNDKDRLNATFEASTYLANLLARYANIEAHYRDPQSIDVKELENGIVSVYVAILRYSAEVKESQRMGVSSTSPARLNTSLCLPACRTSTG